MPVIASRQSLGLAAKHQLNTNIAMLLVPFSSNILRQQQTTTDNEQSNPNNTHSQPTHLLFLSAPIQAQKPS
jgi:hypothetical protein